MPDSLAQLASLLAQPKRGSAPLPTTPLEQTNPWLAKARDFTQGLLGLKQDPGPSASGMGALMGAALPAAGMIKGLPGFYSRLERAVAGLPDMAHPNKVLSTAKNLASGEEIAARKLGEFLASQKGPVARSAVEAHLAANPLPELRKTVLKAGQTAHANYQVPGGTDYQETLLTLPSARTEAAAGRPSGTRDFLTSHWDQPNVLAHTRANTHTSPTGEPGLLIENVQSDWHQKGRKLGYQFPPGSAEKWNLESDFHQAKNNLESVVEEMRTLARTGGLQPNASEADLYNNLQSALMSSNTTTPEGMALWQMSQRYNAADRAHNAASTAVQQQYHMAPEAPFKDSWPNLAMKQAVLDAANNPNAEWIGITPSDTLRARGEMISPEFQDQRLPLTLEKILAPFGGGKVEKGAVVADGGTLDPNTAPAWLAKLTPAMKQRILKEGLPLLSMVLAAQQLKPAPKQQP